MILELIQKGSRMDMLLKLYVSAFPADERRPVSQMPPCDSAFRFYAIEDAGLLTAWAFDGFTYIEHFAIFPEMRGSGIGSLALSELPDPVILEVEPPEESSDARRRIGFYERNGFHLLDVDYIQPPYSPGLNPVRLKLMLRGDLKIPVQDVVQTIHNRVYSCSER